MIMASDHRRSIWPSAVRAATLFAVDMPGLGGVNVRARFGPVRESWLQALRDRLPVSCPIRCISQHIPDERLLGGLDLAATLREGRPVAERGLLAQTGVLILTAAERASVALAARIGSALDGHAMHDGVRELNPAVVGLVMLDEGIDDESPPQALLDRVAFHLDLDDVRAGEIFGGVVDPEIVIEARRRLERVEIGDDVVCGLCEAAMALGIDSIRASLFAIRTARAAAALAGQRHVRREDATLAAALVLAPRATVMPKAESSPPTEPEIPETDTAADSHGGGREAEAEAAGNDRPLADVAIAATRAVMPPALLAQLQRADAHIPQPRAAGHVGALASSLRRGRPAGVRRGEPRAGARLNIVETLRAAAPWQALRRREISLSPLCVMQSRRVEVRRDDLRVTRLEQRSETISIFAVDASGSSALHRLAEAKGAVEQLLADCYIRRDHVALLAFRGRNAELVLPPTRSLARAKRCLAGLAGGGGTPLALAIDAAAALAVGAKRKGRLPIIILLTDGRANVARDGTPGREKATSDALDAARAVRSTDIATLVVDTSPRPHPSAERLALEMGARYLPLPSYDAQALSRVVQAASA